MRSPTTDRARTLRNNMTETERRIWSRLRNRNIDGYKFRRQFPVGPYFVDFICMSARLVIEVDGPLHEVNADHRKTEWLNRAGYRVLRIPVNSVDESLDDVIHGIYLELTQPSLPNPNTPTRQPRFAVLPTSPRSGEAS